MDPKIEIRNSFDRHARHYEQYAKVQLEIGTQLFERLDYLKIAPKMILDLGCGTGIFTQLLKKKYPKAHVVGCDLAPSMLYESKSKQHWWSASWSLVNADMMKLPFADGLFDLVFANQTLHWGSSLSGALREMNRVMKPGACSMLTTLGPDTFKELTAAWSKGDQYVHANAFIDLHDLGDLLMKTHFIDPVVDQAHLTCHYAKVSDLLIGLKNQGVRNMHLGRNQGLTGKKAYRQFAEAYELFKTPAGKYPLTYEVVYAHAWKGEARAQQSGNEVFIPISQISRTV